MNAIKFTNIMKLIKVISLVLCFLLSYQDQSMAERVTIKNSIGMEFIEIPAGLFMMGADRNFEQASGDELPYHKIEISQSFYIGVNEVTQEAWVAVMGRNPSLYKDRQRPVEKVSWYDTQEFIEKLNRLEQTNSYRLPTEAEWEYAARANSESVYYFGDDPANLDQYAWFVKNSNDMTHSVKQLKPNAWGLFDMHGNVMEWCQDWYNKRFYSITPPRNPVGPDSGTLKIVRGGSWFNNAQSCRSSNRGYSSPEDRFDYIGFRLVKQP